MNSEFYKAAIGEKKRKYIRIFAKAPPHCWKSYPTTKGKKVNIEAFGDDMFVIAST